jgi:hypothetical protein
MRFIYLIFCQLGIHNYEIYRFVCSDKRGRPTKKHGFARSCETCEKKQRLQRPKKYHPVKWVWTDWID